MIFEERSEKRGLMKYYIRAHGNEAELDDFGYDLREAGDIDYQLVDVIREYEVDVLVEWADGNRQGHIKLDGRFAYTEQKQLVVETNALELFARSLSYKDEGKHAVALL